MSTVSDAMVVIRQRVNDLEKINYSDEEIVADVATACRYVSLALISKKDPGMIASEDVVDHTATPSGFHSFVGQFPVWREGPVLRTSTGNDAVSIRFFQMRGDGITSLNDELPFDDFYFDAIVTAASMLLLNRDEFDVSAEQSLVDAVVKMLPGG